MKLSFDLLKRMDRITRIIFISVLLLAFFIPLSFRISIYILAILSLGLLYNFFNFKKSTPFFSEKNRVLILSFSVVYIFYLIGLLNTDNLKYGKTELQSFLSFLIFPLLFFGLDKSFYSIRNLESLKKFFIAGVLVSTLYSYGHSVWMYIQSGEKAWFYYEKIAETIKHPTYFSMYIAFAISILLNDIKKTDKFLNFSSFIYIIILLWFTLFIILLSSKAGLISLVLVLLIFGIKAVFFDETKVFHLFKTLFVFGAMIGFYYLFPTLSTRMNVAGNALNKNDQQLKNELNTQHDGSNVRIAIWKVSMNLIKQKSVFGYGSGDVKDVLETECRKTGFSYGADRHFNCHNQFLQTTIAIGLIGLFALLYFLLMPLYRALKTRNFLMIALLVIVIENSLFESILERQYGIVFSVFFICLFFSFSLLGENFTKKNNE